MSVEFTMAVYCLAMSVPVLGISRLLKRFRYFSNENEWTILKEMVSIFIILLGMGISVYFTGFLVEIPAHRWNVATFFNSCENTFMIGMIPFLLFTVLNYRYLFVEDFTREFYPGTTPSPTRQPEKSVRIDSRLKKEELSFYPGQLIYAESDGNYVVFYLNINDQMHKKIIRNSISNIEQQLSSIPYIMRIHRAFIVNVKQVVSQKGNTLGYRIKLKGIENAIPVSRQNTRNFDLLLKQYL